MGLLSKNQRIWWNQLEASRMSLQTLVDSDVRFGGKVIRITVAYLFLARPKKDCNILNSPGHSREMSNNFFRHPEISGFPNLWAGSWKFHRSISCWLRRKRCHELLIQCGTEIQMWRCTVVVFSLFWRLRPKWHFVLLVFWDWNSPICGQIFFGFGFGPWFFRRKTDVYLPVGCLKRTKQPLKFEEWIPKTVEDSNPELPFHAPSSLVFIRWNFQGV